MAILVGVRLHIVLVGVVVIIIVIIIIIIIKLVRLAHSRLIVGRLSVIFGRLFVDGGLQQQVVLLLLVMLLLLTFIGRSVDAIRALIRDDVRLEHIVELRSRQWFHVFDRKEAFFVVE